MDDPAMPTREQLEAVQQIVQRWKDGYAFNDDSEDDVELASLADWLGPVATKQ